MGYMGFGMQKWIYSTRSRRPFSRDKRTGYDTIPSDKDKFHFGIPAEKSKNRIPLWIFTIVGVSILTITIINLEDFFSIQEKVRKINNQKDILELEEESNYFLKSGMKYYETGNWDQAKRDFEFVLKLKKDHPQAVRYYWACLIRLSENDPMMRKMALWKLDSLSKRYPEDIELNKLKIEFHLSGDTLSAVKELK